MVLGNFAMLAGVDPKAIDDWFLVVYADAYQWVELPNVIGMSQHADGGRLASKPYAGGGAYINRMSDYCGRCRYDVKAKTGRRRLPVQLPLLGFPRPPRAALLEPSADAQHVPHLGADGRRAPAATCAQARRRFSRRWSRQARGGRGRGWFSAAEVGRYRGSVVNL